MHPPPYLTETEILRMASPLKQPAAIRRWCQRQSIFFDKEMPNGLPLIPRSFLGEEPTPSGPPDLDATKYRERFGNAART